MLLVFLSFILVSASAFALGFCLGNSVAVKNAIKAKQRKKHTEQITEEYKNFLSYDGNIQ